MQFTPICPAKVQCSERPEFYHGDALNLLDFTSPLTRSRSGNVQGNSWGTVRRQVRTYVNAGKAATIVGAARPESNRRYRMSYHARCRWAQLPLLLGGMVLLTACHNSGQLSPGPRPASSPPSEVISEAEIADSHATTAYEAIQVSRPLFL